MILSQQKRKVLLRLAAAILSLFWIGIAVGHICLILTLSDQLSGTLQLGLLLGSAIALILAHYSLTAWQRTPLRSCLLLALIGLAHMPGLLGGLAFVGLLIIIGTAQASSPPFLHPPFCEGYQWIIPAFSGKTSNRYRYLPNWISSLYIVLLFSRPPPPRPAFCFS